MKTQNSGVECINGVWKMKCKDCGWNLTHTSRYCEDAKRQGASFAVPATHPYWGLSNKAHPSATSSGGSTAGSNNNDSTISSRMSTLIDSLMTSTESSEVASLLAEIKSCLQGN